MRGGVRKQAISYDPVYIHSMESPLEDSIWMGW